MKKLKFVFFGVFLFFVLPFNFEFVNAEVDVSLYSPADNTFYYLPPITSPLQFFCNASASGLIDIEGEEEQIPIRLETVDFYLNGTLIETLRSTNLGYFVQTQLTNGYYSWTCRACDSTSACVSASPRFFTIDVSSPVFSQNSTISTGQTVTHKLFLQDSNVLSGYIFYLDECTGSFSESSWQTISGTNNWVNVTKVITPKTGCTVRWKVASNNSKNNWNTSQEYSYSLPETIPPTISLNSPVQEGYSNSTSITFNCSLTDNLALSNVTLYGNWSGSWIANETKSLTGTSSSTTFLKTFGNNTFYKWNCYGCDTLNNCNFSSSNRTLLIDSIKPVVKLVSPSDGTNTTTTSQIFQFNVTDNFNINNCSLYLDNDLELTKTSISNGSTVSFSTVSLASSVSGLGYTWYVICYDKSGNLNSTDHWHLTVKTSSSSEESETQNITWTTTYLLSLIEGNTKQLSAKERIRVTVNSSTHYVGVISLTSSSAIINVSSTPQQATFNIGDEKKFEVTGDTYYDVLVKLNSISNGKANVSINTIYEKMPSLGGEITTNLSEEAEQNETDLNEEKNSTGFFDKIFSKGTVKNKTINGKIEQKSYFGGLFWIFFISLIFVVLIFLGYYLIKRRKDRGLTSVISPRPLTPVYQG